MSMPITVFDRLQKETEAAATTECREHVIEQASYAVSDVQQRFLGKFDTLVSEISEKWGPPEFNARTDASGAEDSDEKRHPMPAWVTGTRLGESAQKVLRLSYWRREGNISYVLLRIELDAKDRPNYYDLVLGARRRHKTEAVKVDKLRRTDTSVWAWLGRKLGLIKTV